MGLICARSGVLLHIYDSCGRRRKESGGAEIPGRVSAGVESQLPGVAARAGHQLQNRADPVPNSEFQCFDIPWTRY